MLVGAGSGNSRADAEPRLGPHEYNEKQYIYLHIYERAPVRCLRHHSVWMHGRLMDIFTVTVVAAISDNNKRRAFPWIGEWLGLF